MALRAGLVALSTKLKTGSQRLWFTSVNGYGYSLDKAQDRFVAVMSATHGTILKRSCLPAHEALGDLSDCPMNRATTQVSRICVLDKLEQ